VQQSQSPNHTTELQELIASREECLEISNSNTTWQWWVSEIFWVGIPNGS